MSQSQQHKNLTLQIVIAILAAVLVAIALPWALNAAGMADWTSTVFTPISIGGEIFLRLLRMMVVPLVVTSVMTGVLGLGDIRKLGRPGMIAVGYYITTTFLAVIVGLVLVNVINPGSAIDEEALKKAREEAVVQEAEVANEQAEENGKPKSAGDIGKNLILMLCSDNLIESAAKGDLLPLIVFSIVFAGVLTTMGERVSGLTSFIRQANEALMELIMLIMRFAPIGIFCLVAAKFGTAIAEGEFLDTLRKIAAYFFTVVIGLAVHGLITLPAVLWLFTRRNPYRFMLQISDALLTAFSTASSSATLPVTIERTIDNAGVSRKSVDFVVPLGSTINMDGTALYEAVAAIFIAQVLGRDLTLAQQVVVAVTATLAAIGAAGIPEAGLVTMQIVLTSVGLPTSGISTIITIDWFLDRFRTTVNVLGDAMGAAVVDQYFDSSDPPAPVAPAPEVATVPEEDPVT
ncbi:MAG: dicarboxylate/amino acid:cation symporter [Planctomycetaceae bacterium]|nr:dicarboxylate/amino acid:cation symporter [Planctomycetaceae bacterium]MCB9951495.1 dicarboxylate/amino acid:cation symporter [Planctomycetaceae bacterium]